MIRRAAAVVLLTLGLLAVVPALSAAAAPGATMAVSAAGGVAAKACAPAPEPASPLAGLPGKLYDKPATASDADPFTNQDVKLADVYGYSYRWVNYDNGCVPGSDVLPKAQTGMANFLLSGSAAVSGFTHGLFSLVVTPDFLGPLDDVLTSATSAVKGGFWDPWVTAILLLVAAGVLITAMRADVSSTVTTVGWALLVLVGSTYVMSYPVSSARAVDELVQTTIATSARGVGVANETYGPPVPGNEGRESANEAQAALDDMFDTINRDLFYDAWLEGTLGSNDSAVAREHGPNLFRASHLTWSEAETVKNDPDAGQAIIDAKKDLWVKTAAAVEREDSGAYQQLTGNNGRWDAAGTAVLRVAVMMPFLAVAAVFIVVAYVATRVFVPLAPAFGVLGLLYVTQDWVIGVLKQVGRFIILGPAFFIAALANLLLATAVLDSDLAFGLKLVIVAAIPFVLFKLLRPGRAVPGSRAARRMARSGMGTFLNAFVTRQAVRGGVEDSKKGDEDSTDGKSREPSVYRHAYAKSAPVAAGNTRTLPAGSVPPRELSSSRQTAEARELTEMPGGSSRARNRDRTNEIPAVRPAGRRTLSRRTRGELAVGASAGAVAGAAANSSSSSSRDTFTPVSADIDTPTMAAGTSIVGPGSENPVIEVRKSSATRPEDADVDLSRPADKNAPRGEVIGTSDLPTGVVEASTTYDSEGNSVFEIWRPPTTADAHGDDPGEYR
ncbi:hypothetical protein M1843_15845 [Isoptericola sp. 4D.3]|uniref:TrbL/VirB6 plasmid conjugal transfer protein n=1 Tax=Isoptericola peretonis TaxID=2918523 RepID=A0ABT0J6U7_9MICO|nr:hypothetical protein [Isoptericola sp. 4D.3]